MLRKFKVMRTACLMAAGCATAFALSSAQAATATDDIDVSATVVATCSISVTEQMAFGNYNGVQNDDTATISVTCTNTTTYDVGLDAGDTAGATVSTREMAGPGTDMLAYALYTDAGRTTNWGNTVDTDTVDGTGNGSAQTLTVYGRVSASQFIEPGSYTDTVTATITY